MQDRETTCCGQLRLLAGIAGDEHHRRGFRQTVAQWLTNQPSRQAGIGDQQVRLQAALQCGHGVLTIAECMHVVALLLQNFADDQTHGFLVLHQHDQVGRSGRHGRWGLGQRRRDRHLGVVPGQVDIDAGSFTRHTVDLQLAPGLPDEAVDN